MNLIKIFLFIFLSLQLLRYCNLNFGPSYFVGFTVLKYLSEIKKSETDKYFFSYCVLSKNIFFANKHEFISFGKISLFSNNDSQSQITTLHLTFNCFTPFFEYINNATVLLLLLQVPVLVVRR